MALPAFPLQAFIAVLGVGFLVFLIVQPSDDYDRAAVDSLAVSDLPGKSVLQMLMTWATVLAATLTALLLRRALAPRPAAPSGALQKASRGDYLLKPPSLLLHVWVLCTQQAPCFRTQAAAGPRAQPSRLGPCSSMPDALPAPLARPQPHGAPHARHLLPAGCHPLARRPSARWRGSCRRAPSWPTGAAA